MNKLLSALIAGLMVSGAMAQTRLSTTLQGNTGVSATTGVGVTGGATGAGTTAGAGVSGSGNLSGSTSGSTSGASRADTNLMGAAGAGATGAGTTGSAGATGSAGLSSKLCPPGLANRGNGCMPPGQAKKQ